LGVKNGIREFFRRSAVYSKVGKTIDYSKLAPNLELYLWRPIISSPQMCYLKELEDGTYSIKDLADMHEALDLLYKIEIKNNASSR